MPRARGAVPRHHRHKKIFKEAKGYFGGRSLWLYLLAMAPLVILSGRLLFASRVVTDPSNISGSRLARAA